MALIWRRFTKPKVLISISLLLYVLYTECLQYHIHSWPDLNCGHLAQDFHKILFVADPQILGENTESFFARADCDRFLRLTFLSAMNYVKPDLIVFLGDLMDEGSIANNEQYERYYQRFKDIFQLDKVNKNQVVFIPGDNDIGGEDELVTEFKIKRFQSHFPSQEIVEYKNMKLFQVNSLTKTFPRVNVENDTSIKIVVSHIPLLGIWSTFGEEIFQKENQLLRLFSCQDFRNISSNVHRSYPIYDETEAIDVLKPTVIFSAHDHKLLHLVTGVGTSRRECIETLSGSEWTFAFPQNGRTNEIVVPTCSYRMGTYDMGFGVAMISTKGDLMCYYMLWSPRRLLNLQLHFVIITSLSILYFIYVTTIIYKKRRKHNGARYSRLLNEL